MNNYHTAFQSHVDDYLHFLQYGSAEEEHAMYAAEMASENAWLRAAEYDPEAFDEMAREDMNGYT